MKKTIVISTLLVTAGFGASAAPLINFDTPTGDIRGYAGQTIGWGFQVTADPTDWISFVGSVTAAETNLTLGYYSDLIGPQGGPVDYALPAGNLIWAESYAPGGFGLGSYTIAPTAHIGSKDSGLIDVQYETFSKDPNQCPTCATGFGDALLHFSVTVTPTPEPSTFALFGLGSALLFGSWRRLRIRTRLDG